MSYDLIHTEAETRGKNGNMGYKLTDNIGYTSDRLGRVFLPGKIRRFSLGPRGLATTTPLAGQSLAGPRNRFPPAPLGDGRGEVPLGGFRGETNGVELPQLGGVWGGSPIIRARPVGFWLWLT